MKFYKYFDTYLSNVVDSVKELLYNRHKNIFERIDFYNDNIYLEPLLYIYLNQNDDKWLDSIIYGYEGIRKNSIRVFSNSEGAIYIPKIGYFITCISNSEFTLEYIEENYILKLDSNKILYTFKPLFHLLFGIELLKHQHSLMEVHFLSNNLPTLGVVSDNDYEFYVEHINKALRILKFCNINHFKLLCKCLNKIMLYTSDDLNSFATIQAHNMIFLNVQSADDEMFFIDHISHEGAHVTFNTITFKSKLDLFKYDHNTNFSEVTGEANDSGSLYLRFHGLFTFFEITKSLKLCMLKLNYSDRKRHEMEGRFAFQLKRFGNSLKRFENMDVFEHEGKLWFSFLSKKYEDLYKEYGHIIEKYDLSLGRYDFTYKVFLEKNPINKHIMNYK